MISSNIIKGKRNDTEESPLLRDVNSSYDTGTLPVRKESSNRGRDNIKTINTNSSSNNAKVFTLEESPRRNPFSALTFHWIIPLLKRGNEKDQLHPEDLASIPLPPSCTTKHVYEKFEEYWNKELERARLGVNGRSYATRSNEPYEPYEPSLARSIIQAFIKDYIKAGFLKLIHDLNVFVGPVVLHGIIQFLRSPSSDNIQHGLMLTAAVTVSQTIMSFCLRHYFFQCYLTGLRMRTAIVIAVYKKALVLSSGERQGRSVGEIVNLMTIDAQRIQDVCTYGHAIWYSFLQIGLAIYFLWQQLGPSCLGGVAVILIMVPVNKVVAAWMGRLQKRLMSARDHRVDVNSEVLSSMKVIKLQAWEDSFKKRIMSLRDVEIKRLTHYVLANAFSIMLWTAVPLLVALATFAVYTFSGHNLDVANALTSLALFDILRFPLFMLPQVINNLVEAGISFQRVRMFLLGEEYEPLGCGNIKDDAGVEMNCATFVYDSNKPKFETNTKSKENPMEVEYMKKMYDKDWEIQLLKAQLAGAEKALEKLVKNDDSIEPTEEITIPRSGNGIESTTKEPQVVNERSEHNLESLLALRRVNFECNRGELIAVVGSVGSGKSTFINSLIGEVRILSGSVGVKGNLAYVPQLPFIMNDTVKGNILFGKQGDTFDRHRYNVAISSCALEHDLSILSDGDETEIGEKGITLSGGQKARIGMARAVYHNADVYLLDDPLAAVDAHVGKHLFEKCIVNELLLNRSGSNTGKKQSSIVLVTNAIQYLSDPNVDKIVVLDNGTVAEVGNYKELSEAPDSLFSAYLSVLNDTGTNIGSQVEEGSEGASQSEIESQRSGSLSSVNSPLPPNPDLGINESESQSGSVTSLNNLGSNESESQSDSFLSLNSPVPSNLESDKESEPSLLLQEGNLQQPPSTTLDYDGKREDSENPETSTMPLMTSELMEREKGHVTAEVYFAWAKAAGGICIAVCVLFSYAFDQGLSVGSKWWLTYWSRNGNESPNKANEFLRVYAEINLASICSMFGRVVLLMMSGLRASKALFSELLDVVLLAPMSFFDTTPTGRLVNRFSKDIFTVDEKLVSALRSYLATSSNVIAAIIVTSYVTPSFTVVIIPMVVFYSQQQKFFTKSYRELKRLDAVSRSPLYALLGETLDGVSTIRAYKAEGALTSKITRMLDEQQNAYFLTFTAQCWLAIRLELVGTLIICTTCLCAVLEHKNLGGDETFAGLAGLAISFSLSITQSLNWSVRMASELEANMVSVERVRQYCKIKSEAPHHVFHDRSLQYTWPSDGKIVFSSATLRYRDGLPLVLKGLDIVIPPESKVGVVGRTGAGKSTVMVSILRIVELSSGSIHIDGIDISKIGLNLLRSKIAVIPQDPVLFSGSIRSNLDPFHEYDDDRLHEVLERVGLLKQSRSGIPRSVSTSSLTSAMSLSTSAPTIKSLTDEVTEGGSNFSVGQRQLLVIARALLRGAKIVIMDEATASVDADTDARIQNVIRKEFKESTCITIAHRINTILDSDYILVMDDGKAAEFDKPDVLLKKGGLFKDLVVAWDRDH